jgi:hypothetical protein
MHLCVCNVPYPSLENLGSIQRYKLGKVLMGQFHVSWSLEFKVTFVAHYFYDLEFLLPAV